MLIERSVGCRSSLQVLKHLEILLSPFQFGLKIPFFLLGLLKMCFIFALSELHPENIITSILTKGLVTNAGIDC